MARERILVVDDEEDILELLQYNLARDGYAVTCVATGEAALEAVRQHRPDLLVLDLMLPGIDGLEICRRIMEHPHRQSLPAVPRPLSEGSTGRP